MTTSVCDITLTAVEQSEDILMMAAVKKRDHDRVVLVQVTPKVSPRTVERADALVLALERERDMPTSRNDVLREAIELGLASLERRLGT